MGAWADAAGSLDAAPLWQPEVHPGNTLLGTRQHQSEGVGRKKPGMAQQLQDRRVLEAALSLMIGWGWKEGRGEGAAHKGQLTERREEEGRLYFGGCQTLGCQGDSLKRLERIEGLPTLGHRSGCLAAKPWNSSEGMAAL